MDAAAALADLTEISSQIQAAVLFAGGEALGSTLGDESAAAALVRGAGELLDGAASSRRDAAAVTQLEASLPDGSVFVVRDGERGIVAVTGPQPTVGLVFYDLKSCLRAVADGDEKPARRRRAKKAAAEETSEA